MNTLAAYFEGVVAIDMERTGLTAPQCAKRVLPWVMEYRALVLRLGRKR